MPAFKKTAACLARVLLGAVILGMIGPAPAQSQDSSSMLPEPVRQKIEQLLKGAEEDLANGRLGGAGQENAISKYLEVESMDPGNSSAYEGLKRIAGTALDLARDALALDDHLQASEFLELAVQAGADPQKVAALKKKIKPPKAPPKKESEPAKADQSATDAQDQSGNGTKSQPAAGAASQGKAQDQGPETSPAPGKTQETAVPEGTRYERVLNGERYIRRALEALVDGNKEEARWNLEQARQLVPQDPGIKRLEKRLEALEEDSLRGAELRLDKAEALLKEGRALEAEKLVDEAAAVLGWGGRVAQLKSRIRETQPRQAPSPAPTGGGLINSSGLHFKLIPAGRFLMGSAVETMTRPDELPRHEVFISKPFWFGVTEVTQAQWTRVMGENPSRFKDDKGLRPVEQVTFAEVAEFLKKLNEQDKTLFHRLPTEAEWEYACRAGTSSQYSYGDDPKELIKYAWYVGSAGFRTQPTGLKKANPWGLHDIHGNVWELCSDWYADGYYGDSPPKDPPGPKKGRSRVIRGGCFLDGPVTLRSAHRATFRKSFRTGFRVVAEKR